MKKLTAALVALAVAAPALAQDIAPPVKRAPAAKPAAAAPAAPAASNSSVAPAVKRTPAAPSAPAPQTAARTTSARDYQAALTAAAGPGSDAALDGSLIRVMSNLLAAGRCGEATALATRDGRTELANRAKQLCR